MSIDSNETSSNTNSTTSSSTSANNSSSSNSSINIGGISGSISGSQNNATSTTHPPGYEELLNRVAALSKPQTVGQIRAAGEAKIAEAEANKIKGEVTNKRLVLIMIGIITIILTVFGCYVFIKDKEIAKDVWVIIGPIITAGISGTIGFLTGERQASNTTNNN